MFVWRELTLYCPGLCASYVVIDIYISYVSTNNNNNRFRLALVHFVKYWSNIRSHLWLNGVYCVRFAVQLICLQVLIALLMEFSCEGVVVCKQLIEAIRYCKLRNKQIWTYY